MANKKLTAVEILYERLERMIPRTALYNIDKKEYLKQALELEKEQIDNAYIQGFAECDATGMMDVDKYYNETYGNKESK